MSTGNKQTSVSKIMENVTPSERMIASVPLAVSSYQLPAASSFGAGRLLFRSPDP